MPLREAFNNHLRRNHFIMPSFENYGRISGLYDYGPMGSRVLNNFLQYIRRFLTRRHEFNELVTTALVPEAVLRNSGHVERFISEYPYCENCQRFVMEGTTCPGCGMASTTSVQRQNLFKTGGFFLRPETTHSMVSGFKELNMSNSVQVPSLYCQIGATVFRDEISPRSFIMRLKEFRLVEAIIIGRYDHQFIRKLLKLLSRSVLRIPLRVNGELRSYTCFELSEVTNNDSINTLMALVTSFLQPFGVTFYFEEVPQEDRAHYSNSTWDIFMEDLGGKAWEVGGIADRGCFDLEAHIQNQNLWEDLVITELSLGVERLLYLIMSQSYSPEREVLGLPEEIAPYQIAIFPLIDHEDLEELGKTIFYQNHQNHDILYSVKGSIGRRYRHADSIGIRYCVTIDFESIENNTVTIRDSRDRSQKRIPINEIFNEL